MLALMASENRAAAALGRTYPGGMPAFVTAMNAKAEALGMTDSHFVEPTACRLQTWRAPATSPSWSARRTPTPLSASIPRAARRA